MVMERAQRRRRRRWAGAWPVRAVVFGLLALGLAAPARADLKPKERERGPDAEGRGDAPHPQAGADPLEPIIELMRKVQRQLAEADAGRWTQAEQRRIAEALDLGGDAVEQLAKLIEEIEANSQAMSGGGGGGKSGRSSSAADRQRRRMRQRRADGQRQGVNPQRDAQRRGDGQRERRDRQAARNDRRQRTRSGGDPGAQAGALPGRKPSEAARWGDLPMKEVREALDARRGELPPRWRRLLERYYRRLSGSER